MMRVAFLVVILLILPMAASPIDATGTPSDGLMITAMMPVNGTEFIIVANHGDVIRDIGGMSITDGEGVLRIPEGTTLVPGGELVMASGERTFLTMEGRQLIQFSDMDSWGSLILADRGDWVHLMDGDIVLDTVVYGDVDRILPGWEGPPATRPGRCEMLIRGGEDTDTRWDWQYSVPGRSSFSDVASLAEVRGFLFPEEGYGNIMWELQSARNSVAISIYQMDNSSLMRLLSDMARAGVDVSVVLEGQPVGGIPEDTAARLLTMAEAGCDIRLLRSSDGYKRYDYMHAKYAVVDGAKFIVTSENWRTSVFESNRGWGMVGYSEAIARHLLEIHDDDGDIGREDVYSAEELFSYLEPADLVHHMPPAPSNLSTTLASVSASAGPDAGLAWLASSMEDSSERLFSQQFYCQTDWVHGDGPLRWMRDAGERGVDSRLLLDSTFMGDSQGRNGRVASAFQSWPGCQARLWEGGRSFTIQHNKGLVVDDSVIVSSFNWVDSSFMNNRELAVTVSSPVLADRFAAVFLDDWCQDPLPPVALLDLEERSYIEGETVLLSANRSHDNVGVTSHLWDMDGDGVYEREGSHILHVVEEGRWDCSLRVMDGEGNQDEVAFVLEVSGKDGIGTTAYLPLAGLCMLLAAVRARRMLKERAGIKP